MGPDEADVKEMSILGRTVKWVTDGITIEADEKHRKKLMDRFGFDDATKGVKTNGDKELKEEEGDSEELVGAEIKEFRGMAATLKYYAQDCPEMQFVVKEVASVMARPTNGSWRKVKRTAEFLVGRKAVVWKFGYQEGVQDIPVYTDSDWDGSREMRKSTTGGALLWRGRCWKTWSATRGAVALSSAEAEFHATVDGVQRAKWAETVARELGRGMLRKEVVLATDAEAAKSFVSRLGVGQDAPY